MIWGWAADLLEFKKRFDHWKERHVKAQGTLTVIPLSCSINLKWPHFVLYYQPL